VEPALHASNTRFEWRPRRGPFRRISDAQARAYDEQGFFLLPEAITAEECTELIAAIDPLESAGEELLRQHGGRLFIARADEITFTPHLVTRSPLLRRFCAGPVFADLVHDLIGPDVRLYWDQAVYKKPGMDLPFPWHQDNGYTFIEPQQYLTCWVALSDASEANGCPWVVPKLHRRGTLAHERSALGFVCLSGRQGAAVPVPARAGDIVVFSSLTPHSTGPNASSEVRKTYIVQFAPDGAAILTPEGARIPANAPERQFPVLVAGKRPLAGA
jgi:ectoine hydroxylase-related dioxygenase (phytanoyl-CoA dioxygenase family)